ncbi:MAG: copper chaperone PCu(A)C [Pseudomonadota bacterium]
MKTKIAAFVVTLLLCISSHAGTISVLEVTEAWARSSMPPNNNSAAYMTIQNNTPNSWEIIGATAMGVANNVEIHQSYVDDKGISRMTAVDKLVIPANSKVELKPNGTHIMLMNLQRNLSPGDKISINLIVEKFGVIPVQVEVRQLGQ